MSKVEIIATSTFGLEAVVAREVKNLGYENATVENGKVTFTADKLAICRANLWLRTAERIRLKIGEFKAVTFDELFEKTKALPWAEWLPVDAEFPVEGKSVKSTLFSVSDCQAIVKKAVVESMKKSYNRQWFDETGPLFKIEVALHKDIATLTIDTSGVALHKRGYRRLISEAPLKETMAAAMIQLSYWNPDRPLHDPFCGSGTIPIEAALIGRNIAPGMNREFASEQWPSIPKKLWQEARRETHDLANYDRPLEITGSDLNGEIIEVARENAEEAMVDDAVRFKRLPLGSYQTDAKYGCIITNPPYGERIGQEKEVAQLYKTMGKVFKSLDTWSLYAITSHPEFEALFGKKADRNRKLYNGNLKTYYYQYFGPRPPR